MESRIFYLELNGYEPGYKLNYANFVIKLIGF